MKKLLLLFLFLLPFLSQSQSQCGQAEITEHFFQQHPEWRQEFLEHQKKIQPISNGRKSGSSVTAEPEFMVPVVFHVLHHGGPENISDAQIQDQIRILNRDYQRQNADTANIVAAFQDNIAHVGFGFKLARIDPDGHCTNGIVRHFTTKTNWDANDLTDFTFSWPRNKYLNIYVVKSLNIAATAYAFLPGTPVQPGADVIVTIHSMVGSIGTGTVANSRVLTHEVGHWFGLQHIWGTSNQPGVTCGDDLVTDTPITKGFSTCATSNTGVCNPGTPENVQNYMDYSPCKIMFTNGQSDRMHGVITGSLNGRNNISSVANLAATGLNEGNFSCTPFVDFKTGSRKQCAGNTVVFTSLSQSGSGPFIRLWTFTGGNPANSSDSIVSVTYATPGTYPVSLQITNSFGTTIENREAYLEVGDGNSGTSVPYAFDFETDSLVAKLAIDNPDQNETKWMPGETTAGAAANKCHFINSYFDYDAIPGEKDAFELPPFNLTGLDEITLSYKYAYARLNVSQRDSFKVQYSLDCGANWTSIGGLPTITQMASASGGTQIDVFNPTETQWVQQTIPSARLSAIANRNGVRIRFLFVKDINKTVANNIYIDEINLTGITTGTDELLSKRTVSIYPNPSEGSFVVSTESGESVRLKGRLFDTKGQEIKGQVETNHPGEMVVNSGKSLDKGVYTLMLDFDGMMMPKKLVVY